MSRRVPRAARAAAITAAFAVLLAIATAAVANASASSATGVRLASASSATGVRLSSATAVRLGGAPSIPHGATVLGSLSSTAPLHLTITLNPRDPAGLSAYATEVATPGSAIYRHYLTPAQFAQRFGASSAQIAAVQISLRSHGLTPGQVSANGLSIPVSATAQQVSRAFSVTFRRLALAGGKTAIASNAAPLVDADLAAVVQSVLGLDSLSAPRPLAIRRAATGPRAGTTPHAATGGPQPCAAARAAAPSQSAYTMDQLASAYGFSGLYTAGDQGAGQTIALFELEPYDPADVAAFQACYGTHASVSNVAVDGGAGAGAGSGEAALDIETAIGLAPQARFLVYEGPNSNSGGPGSGFYDTFSAVINQNKAKVVSSSWGQCEPVAGASAARAESTLFQEAAVQGQSILSASGDDGSEDCNGGQGLPNPALAVDDPSSQPFITGVGGTSLNSPGPRPSETVWNNGGNLGALFGLSLGAGGGGISSVWGMPGYQAGAPSGLHVVGPTSSGAPCGAGSGYCREVPDVSADADPNTGYLIYWNGSGSVGGSPSGWQGFGGTSAAAPTWVAVIALADASAGCKGSPLGFVNPALYRAAAGSYGNDFNDIVSGNNDFTGSHGGEFAAGPGYDLATGLGSPNSSALAAALCPDTIRITNPGPQRATRGVATSLVVKSSDAAGVRVSYAASGLPPGLTIGSGSGRISGTPKASGTYSTRVVATDSAGATAGAAFSWTVGDPPRASPAILKGAGTGRPVLSFTLQAGHDALPLRSVTVQLPAGLRTSGAGSTLTVLGSRGRHLRFTASTSRGVLTITLRSPSPQMLVTIAYPKLIVSSSLAGRATSHHLGALALTLTVTDSARHASTVRARVRT